MRAIRLYVEKENENGLRAYRGHGMKEAPYLVFEQVLQPQPQPQPQPLPPPSRT